MASSNGQGMSYPWDALNKLSKLVSWLLKGYSSTRDQVAVDISAEMLTERGQLWAPSVNIEAKYPALPDHDGIQYLFYKTLFSPVLLLQLLKS